MVDSYYSPPPVPENADELRRFIRDELEALRADMPHVFGDWYDNFTVLGAGGLRGVTSDFDYTNFNSTGIYQPAFAVNEVGFVNFHINHDIKRGSKLYPHIHISSPGTSQEDVVFEYTYSIAERDDDTPAAFQATNTITLTFKVPTTAHSHKVIEVSDVDAIDTPEVDAIIIGSLTRISNGGTDHPNRVFVHFVDQH